MHARLSGSPEERAALIRAGAEAGIAEAQAVWGQMRLDAGEARDGLGWFVRAAAQGHLMALNMVGRCYDLGWGVAVDKGRAAECFRIAAERGLGWAMYNHATALALGAGVAEDRAAARDWLERAIAAAEGAGEPLLAAKALNFVGSFAEDGWAGPVDMIRAADCYARSARGGDFRGCFNHARMLAAAGEVATAADWIAQAGQLGHDRFRAQMRDWLARAGEPLRALGLAALSC